MEEIRYQRSVTKLAIARRVIDKHQITRHYKNFELQDMITYNFDYEETRPILKPPADELLRTLLMTFEKEIYKYHEHQILLENRPDEELNEDEMKMAWEEFNKEKEFGKKELDYSM